MTRKIKTANEMFDILSTMGNGKFATICHMGDVKINYPDEKVGGFLGFFQHTEKGNPQLFGKRFGLKNLSGIIRITRYRQLNWLSQEKMGSSYSQFRQNADNIRQQFGVPKAKPRKSPYETIKYGNGIRVGNTPNIQGRAYVHQNTYSAKKDTIYLGIDNLGHIVKEFKYDELKQYFQYSNNIDGLNALRKLTKDNNVINDYISKILSLKMQYRTFFNDRIIYIIGSSDSEQFYFTNNNLTSSIGDIYVRPQEIISKVKQLFNTDTQIMQENIKKQNKLIENMKRNTVRLTEAQLHRVIRESVNRLINEISSRRASNSAGLADKQSKFNGINALKRKFKGQRTKSKEDYKNQSERLKQYSSDKQNKENEGKSETFKKLNSNYNKNQFKQGQKGNKM